MIRSSTAEIRELVAALSSADGVKRESAVARLAIIGERAMDRLSAAYGAADHDTRLAILRTAEAIAHPRAIPLGLKALQEGGDVAVAAASTLRALLESPVESAATQALDALVATALDASFERRTRLAAFDALQDMPSDVRDRIAAALRDDADPGMQARAAAAPHAPAATDTVWQEAISGVLPEDPAVLREAVRSRAAAAPLSGLQKLVEAVKAREQGSTRSSMEAWRGVRGALHQALALRGSRVALYDLREELSETPEPLPPAFLAAAHVVGDASCLEPIAAAWTAASDGRWRQQLETAFQAIVAREKLSRRSAALKRVGARFPEAAAAFSTTSRTMPRPKTPRRT